MKIPKRPSEFRYTLRHHAERDDAPTFVFRLPDAEEEVELQKSAVDAVLRNPEVRAEIAASEDPDERAGMIERRLLAGEIEGISWAGQICGLFDACLLRIDGLWIDDEAYDHAKHRGDIPGTWKAEVGHHIRERQQRHLTEVEEGNFSSPSSSADEGPTVITTTTPAAAASDASQ